MPKDYIYLIKSVSVSAYCSCKVFLAFRSYTFYFEFIFYLMAFNSISHSQSYVSRMDLVIMLTGIKFINFLVKWTFLWEGSFLFKTNYFEFLFISSSSNTG